MTTSNDTNTKTTIGDRIEAAEDECLLGNTFGECVLGSASPHHNNNSIPKPDKEDEHTLCTSCYGMLLGFGQAMQRVFHRTNTTTTSSSSSSYGTLPPTTAHYPSSSLSSSPEAALHDPSLTPMSHISILSILSTAFAYGSIMTTLFLLTLPIICEQIEYEMVTYHPHLSHTVGKSLVLGGFAAVAGMTQLATPLIGLLSDRKRSLASSFSSSSSSVEGGAGAAPAPDPHGTTTVGRNCRAMEKRIPYLIVGTIAAVVGCLGQMWAMAPIHPFENSLLLDPHQQQTLDNNNNNNNVRVVYYGGAWITFALCFAIQNLGLNTSYTVMMALIPDIVPGFQTGVANGSLATMVVTGSLFGFGMFHVFKEDLYHMYGLYVAVTLVTGVVTYWFVLEREMFVRDEWERRRLGGVVEEKGEEEERGGRAGIYHSIETSPVSPSVVVEAQDGVYGSAATEQETTYALLRRTSWTPSPPPPFSPTTRGHNNYSFYDGVFRSYDAVVGVLRSGFRSIYALFYEPLADTSFKEIIAAYTIDSTRHRDFLIVTFSRFFYYMGISSQTFFLYFVHDDLLSFLSKNDGGNTDNNDTDAADGVSDSFTHSPAAIVSLLAVVANASGAIACYPVGVLSDSYFGGRRKPFVYASCIVLAMGNLALQLCRTLDEILFICVCLGAANGVYLTMDTSLAVDTINDDEQEEVENNETKEKGQEMERGVEVEGMVFTNGGSSAYGDLTPVGEIVASTPTMNHNAAQMFGVWGVFGFLGSSIGPLTMGCALLFFGRISVDLDSNSDSSITSTTEETEQQRFYGPAGYMALFCLSAFYFACSALTLTKVKKKSV